MDFMQLAQQLRGQGGVAQGGTPAVGGTMFPGQQGPSIPQASAPGMAEALMGGVKAYNKARDNRPPQTFTGADAGAMGSMGMGGGSALGTIGMMSPGVSFPGAASGLGGVASSSPYGALFAGAKALNDSGISSYGDTIRGKWSGNLIDRFMGGPEEGGAIGQSTGAIGKFMGGDFEGGVKSGVNSLKDLFKLKLF